MMRMRIHDTHAYAEVSKDSGTSWILVKTWTRSEAGDLYAGMSTGQNGKLTRLFQNGSFA